MNINAGDGLAAVSGLSSLDDPVRRRLYEYVASRDEPAAREDAAAAAGISRTLAAYHLDKLAEVGILSVSYARPPGRSGPGAGRPAKQYARTRQELLASLPPRNYVLLANLLAEAVHSDGSGTVRAAVTAAAREAGRAHGTDSGVVEALCSCGYEPAQAADGSIELRNCPFDSLAREHTDLVCGLNLHLIQGMLEVAGDPPRRRAVLAPRDGRCCVVVHPPEQSPAGKNHPKNHVKKLFHRTPKPPRRRTKE